MKKYKTLYLRAKSRMQILEEAAKRDNNFEALKTYRKCIWALNDTMAEIENNEHNR